MKSVSVITINIISIILAIIGIIIILCQNNKNSQNCNNFSNCDCKKNAFYGDAPHHYRHMTKDELTTDSWSSFKCNDTISDESSSPDCQLNGHRASTPSALLNYVEFDPN
jgi:hypothetical protein